jgi:uncharacterized protein (TIGR02646 family)
VDAGGQPKVFATYAAARADLFARLGRYCSFCERRIPVSLAVEHVVAKSRRPALARDWKNFLLACQNCNSTKGTKLVGRHMFLPDADNTFRALEYSVGGKVKSAAALTGLLKGKATRLIRLVGLDKRPTADPEAKDLRWEDRREAWDKATRYQGLYAAGTVSLTNVVDLCLSDGHWSIWMTVFAPHAVVRQALIAAWPGTAVNCFDAATAAVVRPGGQI